MLGKHRRDSPKRDVIANLQHDFLHITSQESENLGKDFLKSKDQQVPIFPLLPEVNSSKGNKRFRLKPRPRERQGLDCEVSTMSLTFKSFSTIQERDLLEINHGSIITHVDIKTTSLPKPVTPLSSETGHLLLRKPQALRNQTGTYQPQSVDQNSYGLLSHSGSSAFSTNGPNASLFGS